MALREQHNNYSKFIQVFVKCIDNGIAQCDGLMVRLGVMAQWYSSVWWLSGAAQRYSCVMAQWCGSV